MVYSNPNVFSQTKCPPRKAFTFLELLVVLAAIGLLVSVALPALRYNSEQTLKLLCQSNLRATGLANQLYADDK